MFYYSFQIKLVNINASDVVDGKSAVVLGLIWTIILYFQVRVSMTILTFVNGIFTQLRCNDLLVVSSVHDV